MEKDIDNQKRRHGETRGRSLSERHLLRPRVSSTPRAVTEFMAQMIDPQIGEKMAENCTTSLIRIAAA